jgi:adhesin transport system outer membrane protein
MILNSFFSRPAHTPRAVFGLACGVFWVAQAWAQPIRTLPNAQETSPSNPAFEALMVAAIHVHPDIKSAQALAQGAQQDVSAAKWGYWPTLSLDASRTDQSRTASNGTGVSTSPNSSSLTIQQPLWTGGALTGRVAASEKLEQASLQQIESTRLDVALKLLNAWGTLLNADASRVVATRTLTGLGRYRDIMVRRVQGGLSSDVELNLLTVRISRAQADLSEANAGIELALQRIEKMVGAPVASSVALKVPLSQTALKNWVQMHVNAQVSDRASQHPAIRRAELEAQAAADQLEVVKADRWPKLVLSYQRRFGGALNTSDRDLWALGLNYTTGSGLSNFSKSQAEASRLRARQDALDSLIQDKQEQLVSDASELKREFERQDSLAATISSARAVLASYERQYFGGLKSWQEVLNALQELSQSELRQAQAVNATTLAYYRWRLNGGELPTQTNWMR